MGLSEVCPTCLQTRVPGEQHSCYAPPEPESKIVDGRMVYSHPGLQLRRYQIVTTLVFDVPIGEEVDTAGMMAHIEDRLEMPEDPHRYPTVEPYYMVGVLFGSLVEGQVLEESEWSPSGPEYTFREAD